MRKEQLTRRAKPCGWLPKIRRHITSWAKRSLYAGDSAGARELSKNAIAIEANRPELHDDLGSVLVQLSKREEAAAEFSEALKLQPQFAQAHLHLGVLRLQQKDIVGAESELRTAINLEPDNSLAHYYLGQALESKGAADAALQEFQYAARLDPNNADVQKHLGTCCNAPAMEKMR